MRPVCHSLGGLRGAGKGDVQGKAGGSVYQSPAGEGSWTPTPLDLWIFWGVSRISTRTPPALLPTGGRQNRADSQTRPFSRMRDAATWELGRRPLAGHGRAGKAAVRSGEGGGEAETGAPARRRRGANRRVPRLTRPRAPRGLADRGALGVCAPRAALSPPSSGLPSLSTTSSFLGQEKNRSDKKPRWLTVEREDGRREITRKHAPQESQAPGRRARTTFILAVPGREKPGAHCASPDPSGPLLQFWA